MTLNEFVESAQFSKLSFQAQRVVWMEIEVNLALSRLNAALREGIFSRDQWFLDLRECIRDSCAVGDDDFKWGEQDFDEIRSAAASLGSIIENAKCRGLWRDEDETTRVRKSAKKRRLSVGRAFARIALEGLHREMSRAHEAMQEGRYSFAGGTLSSPMYFIGVLSGVSGKPVVDLGENEKKKAVHSAWREVAPFTQRGLTAAFVRDQKALHRDPNTGKLPDGVKSIEQFVKLWNSWREEAFDWEFAKDIREAKPK